MKNLLLLTPEQFQTAALAWLGAIVAVTLATAYAIAKIAPLIQQVRDLFDRANRQAARLDSQQAQIVRVALSVPPPLTIEMPGPRTNPPA